MKYRLHYTGRFPQHVIKKRVFKILPKRYYPEYANVECHGGWFEWRVADYFVNSKGQWEFAGYSA